MGDSIRYLKEDPKDSGAEKGKVEKKRAPQGVALRVFIGI
jgi:hypothetical protein